MTINVRCLFLMVTLVAHRVYGHMAFAGHIHLLFNLSEE